MSPLRSNEALEMAVREWSRVRESDLYRDEIFKLLRGWEKGGATVLAGCAEKGGCFNGIIEYI
jgi:hypothetical protein